MKKMIITLEKAQSDMDGAKTVLVTVETILNSTDLKVTARKQILETLKKHTFTHHELCDMLDISFQHCYTELGILKRLGIIEEHPFESYDAGRGGRRHIIWRIKT